MDSKLTDQIIDLLCTQLVDSKEEDFTLIRPLKQKELVVEYKNKKIGTVVVAKYNKQIRIELENRIISQTWQEKTSI